MSTRNGRACIATHVLDVVCLVEDNDGIGQLDRHGVPDRRVDDVIVWTQHQIRRPHQFLCATHNTSFQYRRKSRYGMYVLVYTLDNLSLSFGVHMGTTNLCYNTSTIIPTHVTSPRHLEG